MGYCNTLLIHFGRGYTKASLARSLYFALFLLLSCFLPSGVFAATATEQAAPTSGEQIYPQYPKVNYDTGANAELIKKGEYLVKAGDCIACHTAPNGQVFAGGLPIKTPFGTIYSSNITSDKETGIGNWTDKEFIHAMREGVAPDGSNFFPVFPYPNFNKLSDQDLLAIRAYLNAIPAVHQADREPDMPWPFRWRFLQVFWKLLFFEFKKGQFQSDPKQSEQWNRGAYLVQGLGHCGMCHTPLNFMGAPKDSYALTGGFVDGFYAPNISATSTASLPIDTITNVFLEDRLLRGGAVQGPMLEVNHNSLSHLDRKDLEAIAVYLQSVKSKQPPKTKRSDTPSLKVGEQIYGKYCVGCHGTGAGGAPKLGDQAAWGNLTKQGMSNLYQNALNGIGGMPPKGNCAECSNAEIQSAVDYLVAQSGGKDGGAGSTSIKPQHTLPQTTLERGQKVYTEVCSVCHAEGKLGAPKVGDQMAWASRVKQNLDILFLHALQGYNGMPPKGACYKCSDTDVIAAVKYMVQLSSPQGDYSLW